MSNFDSDGGAENQWEDRGDLAWNEFDWERYLREQDEVVRRYLGFYQASRHLPDRIDQVAEKMNWGQDDWSDDGDTEETADLGADDAAHDDSDDVYTLHKNPIYVATKAIYLGLNRSWQELAPDASKIPQPLAVAMQASLHQGEEQAVQAINALDFGDYAMAISLFKRALSALNGSLSLLNTGNVPRHRDVPAWRDEAQPALFDLREIWLRVMAECREELERPIEDDDEN
jgi:hypothetical protein